MPAKPIPKSLHTVTVLVSVARHLQLQATRDMDAPTAVDSALHILGYRAPANGWDYAAACVDCDPYGLRSRAVAILRKDAQP